MLKEILPISKGFYNWRDQSDNNINYIKSSIARPISDIYELAADVYWNDSWGEEPCDSKTIEEVVRKKILSAPKLIPVFAHRYMPLIGGKQVPIFSIHGTDVICYGNNIEQYLKIEFGGMNQNEVDLSSIRSVPFWSELL
ncbi:MAG: hypothetical protein K6G88_13570 [Lachnospiraceae bacterium]|nr:hypothetical protein [Lachnospiraceae bacterium]